MDAGVAMVQMIENHAEISGELLSAAPDPERPGFMRMTVKVANARAVDGTPNFFAQDVGQTLAIVAREGGTAAGCKPGPVTLRVKKTGPGMSFAD